MRARGRLVAAVVVGVVAVVVALTVVQVRAARAEAAREEAAAVVAAEERRERVEEAARRAEERRAREAAEARATAAEVAGGAVAGATALLSSTEQVADDAVQAVRRTVADAVAGLTTLLEDPTSDAARITAATDAVLAATTTLGEAHGAWLAAEEARAAEARAAEARAEQEQAAQAAPSAGTASPGQAPGRSGGAGPDCGGPDSYEPPSGDVGFFTSVPAETGDGSNGRVPRSRTAALAWCVDSRGNAQWLRADAAAALTRMNEAFRAVFGENIAVDMAYRSYEDQVAMREHYGGVAARPGTSNHGWGTAFDTWEWAAYGFGSARYEWLVANGPAHGWVAPAWARRGGSNPEYWHFEYVG